MLSNVYTKNEILDTLAQRGYFIDAYTLDTFFEQWKVEAIYEDEEGKEFYDKDTLNLILNNLFESSKKEEKEEKEQGPSEEQEAPKEEASKEPEPEQEALDEQEPSEDKINQEDSLEYDSAQEESSQEESQEQPKEEETDEELKFSEYNPEEKKDEEESQEENKTEEQQEDFDDISLISESFEAQQKFREYVVSQLAKSNGDLAPVKNEFKLDISERTLNMIARTLAKKITKYVGAICVADAKVAAKLEEAEEKNKGLEQKVQMLEEQNKKLRMLLTESNKNLNSYKPGFFGLYIKVPPKK